MRDSKGRFPPERQRRFDRAFREIERIGRGRAGSVHEIGDVHRGAVEPAEVERVRWLLVAMAHARGTPGSLAIAALARRGYTIGARAGPFRTTPDVVALDAPDLIRPGKGLPSSRQPWKLMEQAALDVDPATWPERRWCSAHESLRIRAALAAEGHIVE